MAQTGVPGKAVALTSAGALLVYAGLRHESPLQALRGILTGSPGPIPAGKQIRFSDFAEAGTFAPGEGFGSGPFPQLASAASKYLGRPYRWAGTFQGSSGGDCSGLVYRAFNDLGIRDVPRTATTQMLWAKLRRIGRSEVGAGDLTYWPGSPAHIGIAVNNSQGIYSPHTGTVVQIQSIARARAGLICLRYIGGGGGAPRTMN